MLHLVSCQSNSVELVSIFVANNNDDGFGQKNRTIWFVQFYHDSNLSHLLATV